MKAVLPLIFAILTAPAQAQTLSDIAKLEVLSGWQTGSGSQMAALKLTLAPGWKTYWRAPGDAGIPPQIDFSDSTNVKSARFLWPVPEVFHQSGIRSIGYQDGVVVPVELQPDVIGQEIELTGMLDIGICDDICVPVRLDFDAAIMPGGARDSRIVAALVDRPMTVAEASVTAARCAVAAADDGIALTATLTMPSTGRTEDVVIETADPYVWVSEPETTRRGNQLVATVDMVHSSGSPFALDRSAVRITVLGSDRAVDIQGCDAG